MTVASVVSIDLEVGRDSGRIHQLAGTHGDGSGSLTFPPGTLPGALDALDRLADRAAFVLGHNLIAFDLPQLRATEPNMRLLDKPAIDTLRLNPLAFPRNPYHHLVKHYQDGALIGNRRNDPLLDAELALKVFADQHASLKAMQDAAPDLLLAWHWLTTQDPGAGGLDYFFAEVRGARRPDAKQAEAAIYGLLTGVACTQASATIISEAAQSPWPLAYALAWISVAGANSVMPPWVRHQFPETGRLVGALRDRPCTDPGCAWCRREHDAPTQLKQWYGKDYEFRPEPVDPATGRPLQQVIVEAAMRGEHALGILPTGTGKSLCYQVPALSRFVRTGALSVVISPLVALMEDQVKGLRERGIPGCAAINGLLSMPERADVLDRVRLGDVGILLIAPEQLRNRSVRQVLAQRQIGAWIFDEAHCLSKWGQDFRPDYRYVARFIRESAEAIPGGELPLIQCLTATAKPEVVADIVGHFRDRLGVELKVFDGGSKRDNLEFDVIETAPTEKFAQVARLIERELPAGTPGGAIAYCATRKQTEDLAAFLREKGLAAAAYHAGLQPTTKKETQQAFIAGALRVIAATNAFGMGIDKPDVRLVVHADIPGSLENYLQEAGRAGRDRGQARCVLLYTADDVERQHGMSAASRLSRRDIQIVLRALRQLQRRKERHQALVATSGEILDEDEDGKFKRDAATDDTRVRTAIAWLEEAGLVRREENAVQIFPSSLRVKSLADAERKLANIVIDHDYRRRCLHLVQILLIASADEGISTDELMAATGLGADALRETLYLFDRLGIASNDTAMTAYVHIAVEHSSKRRFGQACVLEDAVIGALREEAPDLGSGDTSSLSLRLLSQRLKDQGTSAPPQQVRQIIAGLAGDGRDGEDGKGSLTLKRGGDPETIHVRLNRSWSGLEQIARRRRSAAERLLEHWLSTLPQGSRGVDQLAESTLGQLTASVAGDALIAAETKDMRKLVERALLWLHEQEVLRLNKGLAIFRTAMTLHLESNWKLQFEKGNYQPLAMHYDELTRQIHIMAEYAERGLQKMADALHLALDYFRLPRADFLRLWLPDREAELTRQTTPQSWDAIVETLSRPHQRGIVADDRENTNVLVLAGPGSGKTRVLVHRIAYLVRIRRENPRAVLALAYNRHAALEIRRRLVGLIGDDARGVTVLTCHALAMRLVGASFEHRNGEDADFDAVLAEATALLEGRGLPPEDADTQRDRLLAGFRWILVDEYQDVDPRQYALISALAGRKRTDEDGRLNLFAVGDDDQNIYAFKGASVEFIRRFTEDYKAKTELLIENYRSTHHIIEAANRVIAHASSRMKREAVRVNTARAKAAPGGGWQQIDPVVQGRVQVLPAGDSAQQQALAIYTELRRMMELGLDPAKTAVIARQWKFLDPLRAALEASGIPVAMADEEAPPLWRLRETQALLVFLESGTSDSRLLTADDLRSWLATQDGAGWWPMLCEAIAAFSEDTQGAEVPLAMFRDWLAEWGRASRHQQTGVLLLTAHRAKGLEFDHVFVLDGEWQADRKEDPDAARRLYYVAMTRARATLTLARMDKGNPMIDALDEHHCLVRRLPTPSLPAPGPMDYRYSLPALKEVVLSFAGWKDADDPVHQAIGNLAIGDELRYVAEQGKAWLEDASGKTVGRLSKHFQAPPGLRCQAARVRAVVVWRKSDSALEYQALCRRDTWEVVLPELIFSS